MFIPQYRFERKVNKGKVYPKSFHKKKISYKILHTHDDDGRRREKKICGKKIRHNIDLLLEVAFIFGLTWKKRVIMSAENEARAKRFLFFFFIFFFHIIFYILSYTHSLGKKKIFFFSYKSSITFFLR